MSHLEEPRVNTAKLIWAMRGKRGRQSKRGATKQKGKVWVKRAKGIKRTGIVKMAGLYREEPLGKRSLVQGRGWDTLARRSL